MSQQDEINLMRAIARKQSIEFEYYKDNNSGSGEKRYGNPYAVYLNESQIGTYTDIDQFDGFSNSGNMGFRSFELDYIKSVVILNTTFQTSKKYKEASKRYQHPNLKYLAKID
ncbi:MAG: WYL domain-containing protein [Bacteroidetes bacterium]|nr:MAG: WYL domain-containing protein [Bacteroidota bacterium]TAG90068.1 MAG: WYL domain-containing protein [Bacteroidota bacterium]